MSFHIFPEDLWNTFLKISFLGEGVNAYVVLTGIAKFSSIEVVALCITMSNILECLFPHSLANSCQFGIFANLIGEK